MDKDERAECTRKQLNSNIWIEMYHLYEMRNVQINDKYNDTFMHYYLIGNVTFVFKAV